MMAISLFYRVYKTVCESSNDFLLWDWHTLIKLQQQC